MIHKINNKYSDSILLLSGVIFLIIAGLLIVLNESYFATLAVNTESLSFLWLGLGAVFIAPFIEGFIFRGYFTRSKVLKSVQFIGIFAYMVIVNSFEFSIAAVLYLLILVLRDTYKIKINRNVVYFGNAFLFAFAQFQSYDSNNFFSLIPMIFQFSIGLILIWVTLNFNLIKSIAVHCGYCFLIVLIIFLTLQFPNKTMNKVSSENYEIEWQKTPIWNTSGVKINLSKDSLSTENYSIAEILKMYELKSVQVNKDNLLYNFKIKIYKTNQAAAPLDSTRIKNILITANLAEFKK